MRKLVLLVAILAMVLWLAAPAMGDVSNSGDNSNTCAGTTEQSNEGNIEEETQSVTQEDVTADDNEIAGSQMNFTAETPVDCSQTVEQHGAE